MMSDGEILHCMHSEKFINPFIELINESFNPSNHLFIVRQVEGFPTKYYSNAILLDSKLNYIKRIAIYTWHLNKSRKIILHGLFDIGIMLILFMQPWLLKKCYWCIWGGDLYPQENIDSSNFGKLVKIIKKSVASRIGNLVTYIRGDFELAQKWYEAEGRYCECLIYPSNVFKYDNLYAKKRKNINILLGNSADPSNNHEEMFEKLLPFKNHDISIYCPLSYGPIDHAEKISKLGQHLFGKKFIPMFEFMSPDKYYNFLSEIDIAMFAHRRQQAMGNTVTLLGLGKKIYMRNDITPWSMFKELNIQIFNINELDIDLLNEEVQINNRKIIEKYFSKETLIRQLDVIFAR